MTKLRNARVLLAGLAGIALLLGGVAVASNMGFKFVPDVADGKAFNLSLPWNNNYTDADSLLTDTGADRVSMFDANSKLTDWGGSFGTNFAIEKGKAYVLYAPIGGGNLNPVIVGSHDPNYTLSFVTGAYNAAAPYHQTFTTADELLQDLRASFGSTITRVSYFDENSKLTDWGGSFGTNFSLPLGAGVIVYADADTGAYSWPHY